MRRRTCGRNRLRHVLLALPLLAGCSRETKVAANTDPNVKVEEVTDAGDIAVDHAERYPLVKVEARSVADVLEVNGVVAPDVARTIPVSSLSMGRVLDVRARLGDEVTKGQLLLTLSSPDVSQAFSDYQKAVADEALAVANLERARDLIGHRAIAQKDVQVAENAEQKAKVDASTAAERVRILGGDPRRPSPIIEVRAPVSGVIVEQNTAAGAGVKSLDNSPNLFTIADLSRVWVLCDVYENNLSQVHPGEIARVRLNAWPDRLLQGKISNISRLLDPNTRTVKVRLELPNPDGLLRPGMFATVSFLSRGAPRRAVVPADAVLRLHDKDWVFRLIAPGRFRRAEVQAGAVQPDKMQEIVSGLNPGEQVAANALELSSAAERQ